MGRRREVREKKGRILIGALSWGVIALSFVLLETLAQKKRGVSRLSDLVTRTRRSLAGRLGLFVIWVFVGWHLFARYSLHGI